MNRRNFPASLALSALAVLLLALATAAPAEEEKQIKLWDEETDGHAYQRLSDAVSVDWTGGTIRASGYGFVREADYKVEGIRIGHAISAAQVDAKRNLAEAVSGLRITSSTTVRDMVGKTDRMVGGVRAFVVGARVVSEKSYRKDDMYCCDIVMEAPLGSDGGFASHILHYIQPEISAQFPAPAAVTLGVATANGEMDWEGLRQQAKVSAYDRGLEAKMRAETGEPPLSPPPSGRRRAPTAPPASSSTPASKTTPSTSSRRFVRRTVAPSTTSPR